MKKILAFASALALAGCGGPLIKDGDLEAKLTSLGYSKVLIQGKRFSCGRFGQGKHFIGTKKDGTKVVGQICYKKGERDVQYNVAINKVLGGKAASGVSGITNPWKH